MSGDIAGKQPDALLVPPAAALLPQKTPSNVHLQEQVLLALALQLTLDQLLLQHACALPLRVLPHLLSDLCTAAYCQQ